MARSLSEHPVFVAAMKARAKAAKGNLLDVVEAAYQVESPREEWLKGLAQAVRPHLDEGFGIAAFEYYKPEGALPEIIQHFHLGIPEKLEAVYHTVFGKMDPQIRLKPFRLGPCVAGSQMMGMREDFRQQPHMKRFVQKFGMFDSIWITAAEPSGRGCGFHAGRPKIAWATPSEIERWGRIAAHLSTALRLRYLLKGLLASGGDIRPEAVFDPNGKIHDATGPANTEAARDLLRSAVLSLEKSRGPLRLNDPDRSLAIRSALIAGRWSLVDQVDVDNRRYVVARQNVPVAPGPDGLTAREKQVLGYAKLGHHNKLIAYELGIADSTVRVLLSRAAAKLGVRTRDDLLRIYQDGWTAPGLDNTPPALVQQSQA